MLESAAREGCASGRLGKGFFCSTLTAGKRPAKSQPRQDGAGLARRTIMSYEALDKELALYEKRTPKSAAAHKRAEQRIPLGVASNYRHYEPHPIFVKDWLGSKIHDIDRNE